MALMDNIENDAGRNIKDAFQFSGEMIRQSVYEANKEHFSGYQWVACLDYKTCLICAELDNKIFTSGHHMGLFPAAGGENVIEGEAPQQPIHPNCRCIMVPVLKGMEKDYAESPNYSDWLSRRNDKELMDILGPAKYKAYKNGMPIDRFVRDEKIATLKELAEKRITRKELFKEMPFNMPTAYDDSATSEEVFKEFNKQHKNIIQIDLSANTPIQTARLLAHELNSQIESSKYYKNAILEQVNKIGIITRDDEKDMLGVFSPIYNTINFDHTYLKNMPSIMQQQVKGWFSTEHPLHILGHELAHAYDHYFKSKKGTFLSVILVEKVESHFGKPWQEIAASVSEYATTKPSDFSSEIYSLKKYGTNLTEEQQAIWKIWSDIWNSL